MVDKNLLSSWSLPHGHVRSLYDLVPLSIRIPLGKVFFLFLRRRRVAAPFSELGPDVTARLGDLVLWRLSIAFRAAFSPSRLALLFELKLSPPYPIGFLLMECSVAELHSVSEFCFLLFSPFLLLIVVVSFPPHSFNFLAPPITIVTDRLSFVDHTEHPLLPCGN